MENLKIKFSIMEEKLSSINYEALQLHTDIVFFEDGNLPVDFQHPKYFFEKMCGHIYVSLKELSGYNFKFILRRLKEDKTQNLSKDSLELQEIVNAFRTKYNHKKDSRIESYCEAFCLKILKVKFPENDEHYKQLSSYILDICIELMDGFLYCLDKIKNNEHRDLIVEEWLDQYKRKFPKYKYDIVVQNVLKDMALEDYYDAELLCKQNITKWQERLSLAPHDFVFENLVRKYVEESISTKSYCPLRAEDLIENGVPQGHFLSKLLIYSSDQFNSNPTSKQQILASTLKYYNDYLKI